MDNPVAVWPDLRYASWRETATTLQLWTQIVGKIRLTLTPWLNHGWQVPLYVTARGLGTSPIPAGNEILEIEFDFISQSYWQHVRIRYVRLIDDARPCAYIRSRQGGTPL